MLNLQKTLQRIPAWFWCVIILSVLWALFFWRFLTPQEFDRLLFAQGDFTLHYYAFASFQVEQIQLGNWFPQWNPYNYAGDPFVGNIQWATYYPPRFVTALLAGPAGLTIEAYQMEMIAHYWLVSVMMLLFLRQIVPHWGAALFGSLLYTYGGYLTGYPMLQPSVLEAVAWTPLIMLGVHVSVTRPGWAIQGTLLGSVGVALSFFGGHPQTTMQMIYFSGSYLLYLGWRQELGIWPTLWRGLLLFGLGGGLAMAQLLPALEFTALSARVQNLYYDAKANGFGAQEFLQVLYPRIIASWAPLYLGVAGLLLALGSILRFRKGARFWLLVIGVGLFLSMGGKNVVYDLFYLLVPGFSIFRQQERIASIVAFSLVVLATMQVHVLFIGALADDLRERVVAVGHTIFTATVAIILILAGPFLTLPTFEDPIRGEISFLTLMQEVTALIAILSAFYLAWYFWQRQHAGGRFPVMVGLCALLVLDLFTFNTRYSINFAPNTPEYITQPPAAFDTIQAEVDEIQWHIDGSASLGGHGTYFRIPDIYGTGPFQLDSVYQLLQLPVERRWELFAVRYVTQPEGVQPLDTVALDVFTEGENYEGESYTMYTVVDPRPLAYLVFEYQNALFDVENVGSLDTEEARALAYEKLWSPALNLREVAITMEYLPFDLPRERPEGAVVHGLQMVRPERIEIGLSTPENALLTLAVPNYPGWRAAVNGETTQVVETYAGLIGVPVAAGADQVIVLEMRSLTAFVGRVISAIALLVLFGVSIADRMWQRRHGREREDAA